jgi:hypothetical protein
MGEGAKSMKHVRIFEIELILVHDTVPELLVQLEEIGRELGEKSHCIQDVKCQELFGAGLLIGHRYTVTVSVRG